MGGSEDSGRFFLLRQSYLAGDIRRNPTSWELRSIEGTLALSPPPRTLTPPSAQLICSSEDGELLAVDWLPKSNGDSALPEFSDIKEVLTASPEHVQWTACDHDRPVVALSQSPLFPDLVATVSNRTFHLWWVNEEEGGGGGEISRCKRPLFGSPDASARLTGGVWSPTRPGVLFLSKADGSVDVWDLTDTSYCPSVMLSLIPNEISAMRFFPDNVTVDAGGSSAEADAPPRPFPVGTARQMLAIGDAVGSLHVFEVSGALSAPHAGEAAEVRRFLESETRRVMGTCNAMDSDGRKDASLTPESSKLDLASPLRQGRVKKDKEVVTAELANGVNENSLFLSEEQKRAYADFEKEFILGLHR